MKRSFLIRSLVGAGLLGIVYALPLSARDADSLSVLTVGGGPRPALNQVAIESNVRYVDSVLPRSATVRTLFADGHATSENVLFTEPLPEKSDAEQAFRFLFEGGQAGVNKLRAAKLRAVDGASRKDSFDAEIQRLSTNGAGPILLYFTGHGDRARNLDNNRFALWEGSEGQPAKEGDDGLSVQELASEIKKLPANRPITLVMVQCFSGAFGNVLFENGDPDAPQVDRPICGFFATTRERVAAGCTPEINEAEYHDFTSYFYAALTGKDRLGRNVKATDYNKDGKIGMDEAYLYSLINEPSIDVPICTSDVFLRRFVPVKGDDEIAEMSYEKVRQMGTPGQKDALDHLSEALGAKGDDRLQTALADARARAGNSGHGVHAVSTDARDAVTKLTQTRDELRKELPDLDKRQQVENYRAAREKAIAELKDRPQTVRELLDARKAVLAQQSASMNDELQGARWLRLMRLAKTIVLENRLRASGDRDLIARFDRLKALESQNPLR